jgi:hypothetical protein
VPVIAPPIDVLDQLERSGAAVLRAGGRPRTLDPTFAERWFGRDDASRLVTRQAILPGGEWRAVAITGPRVHIVTQFLYPAPDRDLPLYAMEFVIFGRKPVVAVLDMVGLPGTRTAGDHARAWLDAARPDLPQGDDPPDWYVDCRSGDDIFVRPASLDELPACDAAHDALVETWLAALPRAPALAPADAARHGPAIAAYRAHHKVHTPGLRYLRRSFGEVWTEAFLDVVFGEG